MRNGPSSDLWRGAYGKCAALPRRPPKARQETLVHRHDLGALCRSGPGHRRRRESWVRRMEYGSALAVTNLNSVSIKMPDGRLLMIRPSAVSSTGVVISIRPTSLSWRVSARQGRASPTITLFFQRSFPRSPSVQSCEMTTQRGLPSSSGSPSP